MAGASLGIWKRTQVKKEYFTQVFLTHEKLRKAIILVFPYYYSLILFVLKSWRRISYVPFNILIN